MSATIQTSWLRGTSTAAGESPVQLLASPSAGSVFAGVDPLRIGLALVLCIALGILAILVIRRSQGVSRKWLPEKCARRINVVDTARLNTRATLHLVECGSRIVLLACDASGVKLLDAHDKSLPEPRA